MNRHTIKEDIQEIEEYIEELKNTEYVLTGSYGQGENKEIKYNPVTEIFTVYDKKKLCATVDNLKKAIELYNEI